MREVKPERARHVTMERANPQNLVFISMVYFVPIRSGYGGSGRPFNVGRSSAAQGDCQKEDKEVQPHPVRPLCPREVVVEALPRYRFSPPPQGAWHADPPVLRLRLRQRDEVHAPVWLQAVHRPQRCGPRADSDSEHSLRRCDRARCRREDEAGYRAGGPGEEHPRRQRGLQSQEGGTGVKGALYRLVSFVLIPITDCVKDSRVQAHKPGSLAITCGPVDCSSPECTGNGTHARCRSHKRSLQHLLTVNKLSLLHVTNFPV